MYTPASFAETDTKTLHQFIETHPFATLISQGESEPVASHLPLMLDPTFGEHGVLLGHIAKANSQWKHLVDRSILSIFHGPHAYVSSTWYQANNTVPTWNYVAVHVYGTVTLITEKDALAQLMQTTLDQFEEKTNRPEVASDLMGQLLDSIVRFEVKIERMEGKWKLGQNHTADRQQKVIDRLNAQDSAQSKKVAELMAQNIKGERLPKD
ncbi:MAG: FMN-binding negative transcriptional regulator [Pirellulales bacterium]